MLKKSKGLSGFAAALMVICLIAGAVLAYSLMHRKMGIASVCPANKQIALLNTSLRRLAPSPAFTVPPGASVWVATSNQADQDSLFSGVGGIADVSIIRGNAEPSLTTDGQGFQHTADPSIVLRAPGRWERLPAASGSWKIYTADLGVTALGIKVVSCPK